MAKERKIVWDQIAQSKYKTFLLHIRSESYQNALSVNEDIISIFKRITKHPESYPPDKYKINNDGSYRAFEKHGLRISYQLKNEIIRISRASSVWQEPIDY